MTRNSVLESAGGGVDQGRLIDRLCNQFESALAKRTAGCRIEDLLADVPEDDRSAVLHELLLLELHYRQRAGRPWTADEYAVRFPAHAHVIDAVLHSLKENEPTPPETTPFEQPEPQPVAPAASQGVVIPGYEILGELGRGGMGVVYKARQLNVNRLVAIKMILTANARPQFVRRFRFEAEAVARLKHPNIVQLYEAGEADGQPYFTLEYLDGGSLHDRVGTPHQPRSAAALVETLARAVHAAHEAGIIHRDLKPGNVLLAADGTPKISDFGLAKQVSDDPGETGSGAILGTPNYMAPEQAHGRSKTVGRPADVYALGAILYEMLTGRPPFLGATGMVTILLVTTTDPVPPRKLQPSVPRDLETICLKCLEKSPDRRYPTALALAEDVHRFLAGDTILARPVGPVEHALKWTRRHPTAADLLLLVGTLVVGGPLTALAFFEQIARREASELKREAGEQKRVNDARVETVALLERGEAAWKNRDWKQADDTLDQALAKIRSEPALADLHEKTDRLRALVRDRLQALERFKRFQQRRDEALFHATLSTGAGAEGHRDATLTAARTALAAVGVAADGAVTRFDDSAWDAGEAKEIRSGSYVLLLTLAEIEARSATKDPRPVRNALRLLERADELVMETRAIHMQRVRYLTRLNDQAGVRAEQRRLAALGDKELGPHDHFLVGLELYTQAQLDQAGHEFRRAVRLDPAHFWSHYFLGVGAIMANKPEVAVPHLTLCQGQQPDFVWVYLLRGFALGQVPGHADEAEADFDRVLALSPTPAIRYVLFSNRGVMRVNSPKSWDKGIDDLTRAAALRPDQPQAESNLAEAYRLADRPAESRKHLDRAIDLGKRQQPAGIAAGELAQLYQARARVALQCGDRDGARRDLEDAVRLSPDNRRLHGQVLADLGRLLHLQQKFAEALARYDAARAADPTQIEILRWRAELLLVQHRDTDAIADLDAYIEAGGSVSSALFRQRGLACVRLGKHTEAINDFGRALLVQPTADEAVTLHLYRGQEYLHTRAVPLALADFEDAVRLNPKSPDALLCRAQAKLKTGDRVRALNDIELAVKLRPTDPQDWLRAARLYQQAAPANGRQEDETVRLLRACLERVAPKQRAEFWRDNVVKDGSFDGLRRHPGFAGIVDVFGIR